MPPTPRPTIRIRADELDKYRALTSLTTQVALAERMGVHQDTVRRTLSGQTALTVEFIEALLGVWPTLRFRDLFAVEYPEIPAQATVEAIPA